MILHIHYIFFILYNVWHNFIYGLVKHDTIIIYGWIKNNIVWHIKICLHVCVCLRRENYLGFSTFNLEKQAYSSTWNKHGIEYPNKSL